MSHDWQGQTRRLPLLLAISWLVVAAPAYALDEVNITPLERQVSASGRGIVTLRFEVANRSGQSREWMEQLDLPTGWETISSPAPFLLNADGREVRLIHISIPGGTPSGSFPVRYTVTARDNSSFGGTSSINVKVDSVSGAELTILESPSTLLAGEDYTAQFQITNTGNQAVTYQFTLQDEDGYSTQLSPKSLTLAAGETGTISTSGKIPANLDESGVHKITLHAKGGGKTAEQSLSIPIIARTSKGLGKYQTLPGELRLIYSDQKTKGSTSTTQTTGSQWQTEYRARGALDEDGKHNIEVQLRNGQNNNPQNGQLQSEYRASYWTDDWQIKAGHHGFYGGRLAGNGVSGIGAEVTYNPKNDKGRKPLEIRAFSGESRPDVSEKEKASGAAIQYRFDEQPLSVGASVLNYEKAGKPKNTISSVNATWNDEWFSISGETAKDRNAAAHAIDLSANWQDLSGNLNYQKADPKFEGANQDSQISHAGINWRINDDSRLNATARQSKNNLAADLTKEIREDREQQVRYSHTLGDERNIEITAGYRTRTEKDLRAAPTTDRDIKAGLLEYRHNLNDELDLSATWEQGKRTDRVKTSGTGSKQILAAKWHPEPDWDIGTTYSRNNNLDSEGNSTSTSINGRYRFDQKRDISGHVQRTKNNNDGSRYDSYQFTYNQKLKNRHSIQLSGTHSRGTPITGNNTQNDLWRIEYVMPLDVPIRKRTNIGSLQGKAYYADTQEPAQDLIFNLDGQYAVTDTEGRFSYPNVLAKDYQLQLEASRGNTHGYMLGDEGQTLGVQVTANQEKQVTVSLKPGASLVGNVSLFTTDKASVLGKSSNAKAELEAEDGLGGILLELQPIGEVGKRTIQKRISAGDGSFSFYGIPPGQWQLVVVDTDKMPENSRLEQAQFTIDLQQGDTQEITVRVLPMEQTIQKTGPAGGFHVSG